MNTPASATAAAAKRIHMIHNRNSKTTQLNTIILIYATVFPTKSEKISATTAATEQQCWRQKPK